MKRTPTNVGLCNVFFYVLLPVSLCAAILFRYDFIGIVYLLLLLTWPYNTGYNTAYAKRFTLTTVIFSCIFSLLECIFLAVLAIKGVDILNREPGKCSKTEEVYRFLGMQALDKADLINSIRILVPNFVVFIISLLTYLNLCAIKAKGSHQGSQETQLIPGNPGQSQTFLGESITDQTLETKSRWNKFLFLFTLVFLALSGIASPSALSFPYLLFFLFLTTMYSFHVNLEPQRNIYKLRLGLSVYTACHLLIMYMWQLPSINSNSMKINTETNATDLASRVLGLKRLVIVDCTIVNPCGANTSDSTPVYDLVVDNCVHEDCVKPFCWQNETPDFFEPMFVLLLHFCCAYSYMIFRDFKSSQKAYYSQLSQRSAAYIQEADPLVDATSTFSETEIQENAYSNLPEPSARSPTSAVMHRMSIFKSRLPQKRQIWIALREKVLYVVGLIMMMAWSVTYHSWITFILLLWSCYLWMARDRASVTLRHSKYITLYAIVLILLQFVYSLRLTDDELPTKLHDNDKGEKASDGLKTIGLSRPEGLAFTTLLLRIGFTLVFWLMIHENIRQKFEKQRPNAELPMPEIQAWILEQLARYFIIIVSSFLLFIALNGQVVGYKIIYMLFFLFSGVIFQLSWNMWHRVLRVFWLLLVVYSILVVVLIYTFQLNGFQDYWKNITTLNTSDLEDIGLKYYEDSSGLMMSIFLPTAFLVCCMLQLHYYHERFIVLTDEHTDDRLQNGPLLSRTRFSRRRSDSFLTKSTKWRELYAKFSVFAEIFKRIMWKLLEIHRWKICAIVVIISALSQPSACYLFPALLWILGLPFRNLDLFVYILTLVWASLMLLFNMIYQLEFVHQNLNQTLLESTRCDDKDQSVDLMKWIGFEKVDDQDSFCEFVRGWLSIIIVLLAERVIFRRSRFLENHYPESKVAPGAIFPEIIRENADRSVKECCKFFANYFFHKFGVEVCFISSVITIWTRKDFFGTIYAICLLILLVISSNSRRTLAKVWKGYTIFLSVLWAVEFVLVLNIPKALCVNLADKYYNNENMIFYKLISNDDERIKFVKYLFLPKDAGIDHTKANAIILDFFQLLLAVCQCGVFENENTDTWIKLAGRNDDTVLDDVKDNPHRNFILAEPPTTLDRLKTFVFSMVYWVTFTVVLIAGTNRTSLFCLGYLVASFYFLYQGQMIITCRPSILRRRWNWLLFYNGIVVVTKCCLQLLACVFSGTVEEIENGPDNPTCYLRSLLSLSCEDTSYFTILDKDNKPPVNDCIHEKDVQAVGIAWDFATFVFLLLQRRIFQSYYFLHVREDLIVQIGLSSKGNQLFSLWVQMEAGKRKKNEEIDKERVQESVERIRRNVRSDLQEPYDHFDALRVCDKTWFEGLTETIDDDNDTQTPHGLPQSTSDSGIKSTPGMQHSITDNQINAAGNSPKLPQSFRDIKQGIGNVLFTGRLPGKDMSESKDTLFERPQQTDKEQSPRLPTGGRPRVDWADEHADRVFKSVSYDKSDHIVPMEEDSTMSEPATSPGEVSKSPELTVAVPKEDSEPQGNLLYDTVIYFTRVLNTRTQAYRSIIIQLKRDRQESRNTLPVVADRRYAHQIRNAALNRVARHGTGSNAGSQTGTDVETPSSASRTHQDDFSNYFVSPDDFDKEDHFIQRFLSAIWYFAQFQIDNLCYALMILNGMLNASILSIPMLGMVFLWAMLSVPRPSKRFWVTVIGYTCLVITIKYIFAFKFWQFYKIKNASENDPFALEKIFGVQNRDGVKYLDIAQLLVLFFQRGLLKVHGLWENYDERDLDDDDDNTNLFQVYIVDKTIDGFDRLVGRNKSKRKDKNHRPRTSEQNKNCFLRVIDWLLNKLLVFFKSPGRFYARLIQQEKEKKNMPTDMYIWMLGCDFICFIIIMFGYWAFGKHTVGQSLDITVQIKENTVPKSFLYLLITHFFLILIDRAIYLKKNLMAKLIFHFAQVLVIHIWIFFLLPQITSRSFFKNNVAISLYTFKAIYFAFSAHQIKSGYPTRILQHFLTKRYNYVNLYVFIGYRVCPFIIEFQNIMDWMFVESTVGISRWFMLTTIYHELYQIKCWRHLEKQFHYPRGFPRWPSFKYSGGGLLIVLLIIIMWFPLAFMSIVQTVAGVPNAPKEVKISLSLEGFSDIFTDYSVGSNLIPFTELQFNSLTNYGFKDNLGAQQMLSRYDHGDLFFVKVNKNSDTIWSITEPQKMNMIRLLEKRVIRENRTTCGAWFIFDYQIRRNPNQYEKLWEYASGEAKHELSEKECADFKAVLEGESPNLSVTIHKAIPHYIRALNTDTAREMTSILNEDLNTKLWANVTLNLERRVTVLRVCETATGAYKINATESCDVGETEHVTVKEEKWWKMTTLGKMIPTNPNSDDLVDKLIIISDKTGPESLAWLTGYGVIGLYLSVVLLAGRYTRAIFQYDGAYIMFHEYPNVDELLQLCSDIYLVRELKEWKLEEDLMAKLIYLYRSPETMLKVTKLRPYKPRVKQIKQD